MSTELKNMLGEVRKLSRAEQLALISAIVQVLNEEEGPSLETALVKAIPTDKPTITKGEKNLDPKALFGIWSNAPRTIDDIRQKAWEGN